MKRKLAKKNNIKRDRYTAVLENIHADFKAFGESLQIINRQTKEGFEKLNKKIDTVEVNLSAAIKENSRAIQVNSKRLDKVENRLSNVEKKVGRIANKVDKMAEDHELIKNELALIRYNQVNREEFRLLETRVLRLERAMAKN